MLDWHQYLQAYTVANGQSEFVFSFQRAGQTSAKFVGIVTKLE